MQILKVKNAKGRRGFPLNTQLGKKQFFKEDTYSCQRCRTKSTKCNTATLNAHHILNWKDKEELRYDVDNGIAFCNECHVL